MIRVVFQDQAMYARTSFNFRGAKNVQNWVKKGVFLVILTNLERTWRRMLKRVSRVYFHTWKYVFRVCFKSPKPFYEEDIQWRHQNFLWGHRGSKVRFCGGKYPKNLPKMAYFGHFFLGGSEGKQNLRLRGEMSLCPLDAATDDIQPEIQVPPGVKSWYMIIGKKLGK